MDTELFLVLIIPNNAAMNIPMHIFWYVSGPPYIFISLVFKRCSSWCC